MQPATGRQPLGIGDGLRAFLGGIGFIVGTPAVWGFAAVPALVALTLLACLCPLGLWGGTHLAEYFLGEVTGTWQVAWSWLLKASFWLTAMVLSLLAALFLSQPISGFALDRLSRAQERDLGGPDRQGLPLASSAWLATRATLFGLGLGIPIVLLLTLVGLIVPLAIVVTLPLKICVAGWMLAWDFLDYPFGLRGRRVRDRLSWVGRHAGAFTAFGVAWAMLLIVPGVILLILPMGVAGATRLVVEEER
jgi:uncharacterized protein involved in cysteine biosynthesis